VLVDRACLTVRVVERQASHGAAVPACMDAPVALRALGASRFPQLAQDEEPAHVVQMVELDLVSPPPGAHRLSHNHYQLNSSLSS
jgi:hypothetical protein